jgi:transcriptional regulator with XRE-family HTH domain
MENNKVDALALLRNKLEEAKIRNPNWSLRAFAQKIGVSSGALSEILQGKRALSLKVRRRIIVRLGLSPLEQRQILSDEAGGGQKSPAPQYLALDSDAFHLISDWWHFALLNLVKTKDFAPNITWLAKRVALSKTVVNEAWQRLFRLNYLEKTTKGRIVRRHPRLKTTDDVMDLSIRRAHIEDLKLIERGLLDCPVGLREVSSMTMVIKLKDMPRAKEMIRTFQDEFCESIESEPADEVYRLSVAFFPLTSSAGEIK